MTDVPAELGRLTLFRELPTAALDQLARHVFVRRLARGQILFSEGEPTEHLFLVRSGRLRVVVSSPRGEELVLAVLAAGDAVGEVSILDGQPRSAGVDALDASELLAVPAEDARRTLLENPPALMAVAVQLAGGMRRLTDSAADLVFLDLPRRLAKLLLTEAVARPDGTAVCELSMSQSGVAARVGATRQSLNRALADLVRRTWITVDGMRVHIVDVAALRRFADS
ncbi:MAG TPA: Crp/Fnr family transcriptional regulator [Jatrophihabitans sp.]|nr:Crp/Fnr family transcriptional regulator [Jatrophihabitans sp.]